MMEDEPTRENPPVEDDQLDDVPPTVARIPQTPTVERGSEVETTYNAASRPTDALPHEGWGPQAEPPLPTQNTNYPPPAYPQPPPYYSPADYPANEDLTGWQRFGRSVRRATIGCWRTVRTVSVMGLMGFVVVFGTAFIVLLVIYNSLREELREDLLALQALEGVQDFETTRIYDRHGTLLFEVINEGRRTEVPISQIPDPVIEATVATEDDSFYTNIGFDPRSIARAAWEWYQAGEIVSGGSTITQQLVRHIAFDFEERSEQTLRRKLKEAALAYVMTQQYSKDEILELYLNQINYGNLAYGIEAAANVYFDKPASELTLAEASFIVGMPQCPACFDPYSDFASAKARQRQVLDLMVFHGYLRPEEAATAFAASPQSLDDLASPEVPLLAPHFTVEVRNQLASIPGLDPVLLQRGGLEVYTTLDLSMQDQVEAIARAQVNEVSAEFDLNNASVVVLNPNTGEVLAMVGSIDYNDDSIDGNVNVALSPQQPGSTMKPLTYAAAMERGWTAADILWDVPMAYDTGIGAGFDYEPVNYDERFHGPVRLRDALANSYNIPAVTLAREVTVPGMLEISRRLGIESLGDDAAFYGLSLTLGGGEVTPVEMTAAYGAFANGGRVIEPYWIAEITDLEGSVLYQAETDEQVGVGEQVLDERIAFLINSILSDNIARSPAMGVESELLVDFPAAAKTGTTNDFRDNWTIGYTPHIVVGVWAGNTDNSPMADGVSGLTGAAPIWNEVISTLYTDPDLSATFADSIPLPLQAEFETPENVEVRQVCILSSLRDPQPAEGGCPRSRPEFFLINESVLGVDATEVPPTETPQPTRTPIPTPTPLPPDFEGELPATPLPPLPEVRVELEPGIVALAVLRVPAEQQPAFSDVLTVITDTLPDGAPRPNSPLYCELGAEQESVDREALSVQLFIEAPSNPVDAVRARNWAQGAGVPIEPGIRCVEELIESVEATPEIPQGTVIDNIEGTFYEITSPEAGQDVWGIWPIVGSALFKQETVQFYKIEISGGELPGWVTLGEQRSQTVENGVLEELHAQALPPGDYVIRLVLVQTDGNFVQPTYDVPIRIVAEQPPPTPESP
ncbi:MAG: PBP1A family penicillin-binding protein [Chloroflexi bacterium]|nr:PBP1A family penicillin-binding protein [Chloroflexota bacterium]